MSESQELDRLREKAQHIRRSIIEMLAAAGSGHPGGSLSATDLVTCLYFKVMQHKPDDPTWQDRDRFILSKWEIATATAGAILDINPFDEPNVQQAKDATKALLQRVTAEGHLPVPPVQVQIPGTSLTCDRVSWDKIRAHSNEVSRPLSVLAEFLRAVEKGDYLGLLAYLPIDDAIEASLQRVRVQLRDRCRVATMVGYGPRYLHSTGQLHKGGPNSGVFVMLTATPQEDVAIPGESFSFGTLELAQALGDFASLEATGRRVVRLHLDSSEPGHVERVCDLIAGAATKKWACRQSEAVSVALPCLFTAFFILHSVFLK